MLFNSIFILFACLMVCLVAECSLIAVMKFTLIYLKPPVFNCRREKVTKADQHFCVSAFAPVVLDSHHLMLLPLFEHLNSRE